MSDPFDPDAWPRSSGSSSSRKDDDDQFNPFAGAQQDDDYGTPDYGDAGPGYTPPYGDAYDDDDEDYSTTGRAIPASTSASGPSASARTTRPGDAFDDDYRDEFENDYDDFADYNDGFDDYDNFDEFDREPSGGDGGNNAKRILLIVAGVVVVAAIAGGLMALVGGGDKGNDLAGGTTTTTVPADNQTSEGGDLGDIDQSDSTDTTDVELPEGTTTTTAAAPQAQAAPQDVTNTVNAALAAWGKFAVDGNIEGIKAYFAPNTKQFNRFQLDAATISASPPGGEPIKVVMNNPEAFKTDDNNWTVRGPVVWSRQGELTQNFNWELRLTRTSDRQPWQIISVRQF